MSLGVPAYRRLWLAGVYSFGAVPMQGIARGYLAFELTGSNGALGLTLLGMGVPMLLLMPVGGVVADRFPKRSVLLVATAALWLAAAMIAVVLLADRLEFWMLVAAAVLQGGAFSLMAPARMAFSYELVGRERLSNAILLAQVSMNGTRVLGPALAGALLGIAWLGADAVYLLAVALLTASLLLTVRLPRGEVAEPDERRRSPLAEMIAGLRYVRSKPPVLWPVVMGVAVVATAFPYVAFLPSLVDAVYGVGPGWLGALSAIGAVGAVVASLVIARIGAANIGDGVVSLVAVLFGGFVVALGLSPSVAWAVVVVFATGAANAAFQALNNSLVLLRADEAYHGRVQSLLMLGFSAFGIFAAPLGALADAIGLRTTLVIMGSSSVVVAGALHLVIRRSERVGRTSAGVAAAVLGGGPTLDGGPK